LNDMDAQKLLPVAEARARVLAGAGPRGTERVPLAEAPGRTLSEPLVARRTQPPFRASAMDGFALKAADLETLPATLKLIGESAAGHGFPGALNHGETVRIFTGAPVPEGADAVLMQEDAILDGDKVAVTRTVVEGRHIREIGIDFADGEVLLPAGTQLGPIDIALAAASGHADVAVVRKPRVAILATGDELVQPGEATNADQIVASNSFAIAAFVRQAGGEPIDLGIASDDFAALETAVLAARQAEADVLVTLGGASVGKHDLVQSALTNEGMELGFWRIAMRPGKPLIHGRLGDMLILGLPGNPASSIVCALLFLIPLLRALNGDPRATDDPSEPAILGAPMPPNGPREDYLRARLSRDANGLSLATPHEVQDSSLLSVFARSQCLLVRPPHAPVAAAGDACRVIKLSPVLL
jgi:molybdopterin molybdotransferase